MRRGRQLAQPPRRSPRSRRAVRAACCCRQRSWVHKARSPRRQVPRGARAAAPGGAEWRSAPTWRGCAAAAQARRGGGPRKPRSADAAQAAARVSRSATTAPSGGIARAGAAGSATSGTAGDGSAPLSGAGWQRRLPLERHAGARLAAPRWHTGPATAPGPPSSNQLDLQGAARQLASHCVLLGRQGGVVRLALDPRVKFVRTASQEEKLAQALSRYYGETVRLEITTASGRCRDARAGRAASLAAGVGSRAAGIRDRPGVQGLRERFGATLLPDTVRPVK